MTPGAPDCWHDGYIDGRHNPFDHDRNEESIDKGNQYYRAFIEGCPSVEGNMEDVCVSARDSEWLDFWIPTRLAPILKSNNWVYRTYHVTNLV